MQPGGRRSVAVAVALAVVAAVTALVVQSARSPEVGSVARRGPVTTTSTTSTTTSSPLPPLPVDPTRTEVVTALGPWVTVEAQPPAGTPLDPRATQASATLASMVAPYTAERPNAPALPTVEAPIQGRRATATGWEFDNPTPWGNPLTFIVVEDQGEWLKVKMPVRPNGTEGWIRAADVMRSTIDTRVEIDLSDRTLRAWSGADLLAETRVVIGKDATPTPTGRFYVTDYEEKYRGSAYGPWILPISGYSQTMDEFSGGVPVIAMHGTNRPELVGSKASNGCIRMPDDVIQRLRDTLFLGTPVDIRE